MTVPKRLTPEHRRRIGAGIRRFHERRREEAKRRQPLPRDLELWQERGVLRGELRPLIAASEYEAVEILDARGGADAVSPQVVSMVRSHTRLGVAEQILTGLLLRNPDEPDLASRDCGDGACYVFTGFAPRQFLRLDPR